MKLKKYKKYVTGTDKLPEVSLSWPLYGAGLDKLGKKGKPVQQPITEFKSDELLIRHDAVGLCFTDVKEISYGDQHPRLIGRGLAKNPIIPGHEASLTVVGVGEKLKDQYKIGDRFVIQPDVWYGGKSIPYSFGMDGAYRQYGVMGKEILHGDEGNYLIPIPSNMSYSAAALTEPWACVEASYSMCYRSELKNDGVVWFFGNQNSRPGYRLDNILNNEHTPSRVIATNLPDDFFIQLSRLCKKYDIEFSRQSKEDVVKSGIKFDDIIVLDGDADEVDDASTLLSKSGIIAMIHDKPMSRSIKMDIGRMHYDHIVYVGTTSLNLDEAYRGTNIRSSLKPQGSTLFLGVGGPMGRMHLQRAIESSQNPSCIVATDIDMKRLNDLKVSFMPLIDKNLTKFETGNPVEEPEQYNKLMEKVVDNGGFDDIEVMVTNIEAIVKTSGYIGERGMINLFAGLKRGTMAAIDAWLIYGPRQVRFIGHSGSKLNDQIKIIAHFKKGELQPHRSMAAICGMNQVAEGVRAMMDSVYPGKIVVYPQVSDFPLTGLHELNSVLPGVYDKLENGLWWTNEAESLFLESMLQD